MIRLSPITKEHCQIARVWRNGVREALRTPILLTEEMQDDFYNRIAHERRCEDRYWEVESGGGTDTWHFCGLVGLTDIEFENSLAEISLFLDPTQRRKGIGAAAVHLVLEEAFDRMNLHQVLGECFTCNKCLPFWERITQKYGGRGTVLPHRKYWAGQYWDSFYFSIFEEGWRGAKVPVGDTDSHVDLGSCDRLH